MTAENEKYTITISKKTFESILALLRRLCLTNEFNALVELEQAGIEIMKREQPVKPDDTSTTTN